jgi:hypothetical protein
MASHCSQHNRTFDLSCCRCGELRTRCQPGDTVLWLGPAKCDTCTWKGVPITIDGEELDTCPKPRCPGHVDLRIARPGSGDPGRAIQVSGLMAPRVIVGSDNVAEALGHYDLLTGDDDPWPFVAP